MSKPEMSAHTPFAVALTTEVMARNRVPSEEVPALLRQMHDALVGLDKPAPEPPHALVVPTPPDGIVRTRDGNTFSVGPLPGGEMGVLRVTMPDENAKGFILSADDLLALAWVCIRHGERMKRAERALHEPEIET